MDTIITIASVIVLATSITDAIQKYKVKLIRIKEELEAWDAKEAEAWDEISEMLYEISEESEAFVPDNSNQVQ